MNEELTMTKSKNSALEELVEQLKENINSLDSVKSDISNNYEETKSKNIELVRQLDLLKSEFEAVKIKNLELNEETQLMLAQNNVLNGENECLRNKLFKLERSCDSISLKCSITSNILSETMKNYEKLEESYKRLEKDSSICMKYYYEIRQQKIDNERLMVDLEAKYELLKSESDQARTDFERRFTTPRLENENLNLRVKIELNSLEEKNVKLLEDINRTKKSNETDYEEMCEKIVNLQKEKGDLLENNKCLTDKLYKKDLEINRIKDDFIRIEQENREIFTRFLQLAEYHVTSLKQQEEKHRLEMHIRERKNGKSSDLKRV